MCEDIHVKTIHCVKCLKVPWTLHLHDPTYTTIFSWSDMIEQKPPPHVRGHKRQHYQLHAYVSLSSCLHITHNVMQYCLVFWLCTYTTTCKLAWLLRVTDSWPGCGEQRTTTEWNSGNTACTYVNGHYLCVLNLSMTGRRQLSLKAIHSSHAAACTHLPCWRVVCTRISLPLLCRVGNSTVFSTGGALPTVLSINCWTCTVGICALCYIMWEEAKGGRRVWTIKHMKWVYYSAD